MTVERMTETDLLGLSPGAQASKWLVRLGDGPLDAQERAAFDAWLAADPEHARQYRAREQAWSDIPHMAGLEDLNELMAPSLSERLYGALNRMRAKFDKPIALPAFGAAAAAAAIAVVIVANFVQPATNPLYTTERAQIRQLVLDDGSTVTLGAASRLDVAFTATERRVTLSEGEAFFEVAKNPDRPFVVAAGGTFVRVLGTKFDVHLGTETVRVSVLEGKVEVIKPDEPKAEVPKEGVTHVLTSGQQVVAAKRGAVAPIETVEITDVAPWRAGRLVYVDTPLRDIVADMNRYYSGYIELADDDIGELEYTAAFSADQIDSMISMIATSLSLEAAEEPGKIVLREQADNG